MVCINGCEPKGAGSIPVLPPLMTQAEIDEIDALFAAKYAVERQYQEQLKPIRPATIQETTPEIMMEIKALMARRESETKKVDEKLMVLLEKCDHKKPNGEDSMAWGPCEPVSCGICGKEW